jgi:hypothetical protein
MTGGWCHYRARVPDYDDVYLGKDWDRCIEELPIAGDVLELACGSGHWTRLLAAHLGPVGPADAHVFTAEKGGVLRTSNFRIKVWLPAVSAAGLAPLRPHDLRHTAVALWIAAGANPKEVKRPSLAHFRQLHAGPLRPPVPSSRHRAARPPGRHAR